MRIANMCTCLGLTRLDHLVKCIFPYGPWQSRLQNSIGFGLLSNAWGQLVAPSDGSGLSFLCRNFRPFFVHWLDLLSMRCYMSLSPHYSRIKLSAVEFGSVKHDREQLYWSYQRMEWPPCNLAKLQHTPFEFCILNPRIRVSGMEWEKSWSKLGFEWAPHIQIKFRPVE